MQIFIRQHSLRQRAESNDPDPCLFTVRLHTVLLDRPVEDRIPPLVHDKRAMQILQQFHCLLRIFPVIVGYPCIQRLPASYNIGQRRHSLLKRCLLIHTVVIENIHIIQFHTPQALVNAGHQILPASVIPVRAVPHIISGLRSDDQFVPVWPEIFFHQPAQAALRASIDRPVVIGKVKLCDAMVKGSPAHGLHVVVIVLRAEIMPESQRNCRKFQAASSHPVVCHLFITCVISRVNICCICHLTLRSCSICELIVSDTGNFTYHTKRHI